MIYLCTTGTSAAKLWKSSDNNSSRFDQSVVTALGGVKQAADVLLKTFQQYSMADDEHLHQKLSAEIHSLARMSLSSNDEIVLFASETLDGQACAYAVEAYLELNGYQVKVEVITGLQTTDARRFSRIGVVEFIKKATQYIDASGAESCILNPTGGFKALVPYAVLLGMIRRVSCRYIFEFSSELIELPPLPVDFAHSNLQAIKQVLETIERESSMSKDRFDGLLNWEQRQTFRVLFEQEENEITLSAIGVLILEELQTPSALTVFISQEAIKGLIKLKARADTNPVRYLTSVAKELAKLEQAKHGNAGDGLSWLKPGNTTDRYLVSVENGWRLLVWEIHEHTTYDERSKLNNLGEKVHSQRSQKYAPFFRMEFTD